MVVAFGRPVILGSRVPTADIADRFKAGESPADLAYDPQTEIEAYLEPWCEVDGTRLVVAGPFVAPVAVIVLLCCFLSTVR
jgi:Protein of unknown function (DUF433)